MVCSLIHALSCFLSTVRPEVVLDPVSINVTRVEDNIVLSCSATGFPAPTIVWYHNDTAITTMGRVNIASTSSHYQTNSTVTITSAMTNDTGDYYCNITSSVSAFGPVSSSVALVLVQGQCVLVYNTGICAMYISLLIMIDFPSCVLTFHSNPRTA